MNKAQEKIAQHLRETHSTEQALVRTLQAHISMAPGGSYRTGLQRHLEQTRSQAERLERRLSQLGADRSPVEVGKTVAQGVIAQGTALAKGPLDLVRGGGSPEKILKNAMEESASEAWEIANYDALERLAENVGDSETALLAAEIRAEEEAMLEFLRREIPALVDAVARAEVPASQRTSPAERSRRTAARGRSTGTRSRSSGAARSRSRSRSGGGTRSGGSRSTRSGGGRSGGARSSRAGGSTRSGSRRASGSASDEGTVREGARQVAKRARRIPGVSEAEGEVRGAVASESDLPIANYDGLTADEIVKRLTDLTQMQLSQVDAYERRHENRTTVLERIDSLRGREPLAGYDELTAEDIRKRVTDADERTRREVRDYERSHKNRDTVLSAVS